ncbi:AraC family transcriptional regulator [Pradoshia eiseniae]|uniref:AraC family transcriptional regulator n=1 Tax=Pradoshia eiseniae TaxID=2064768 RepID=A0A2S7N416_9BACI|nr:AraC family transcriptional regulator [Pradoshia eiseniae]PQD96743.1 AraC family transcriptional regulator [Pradoshia eiseniae]
MLAADRLKDLNKICQIVFSISKIDVRYINEEDTALIQKVKQNIPAVLQNFEDDFRQINDYLKRHPTNSFYYYINCFRQQYIAVGIWNQTTYNGFIMAGPFLSSVPGTDFLSSIISENKIPISEQTALQEFYESLSVVHNSASNSIGELLVNLCSNIFIEAKLITSDPPPSSQSKESIKTLIDENKHIIETVYRQEQEFMQAIMTGDKEKIQNIKVNIHDTYLENRVPESPIRASKNLILVVNTLCRVAAKYGGVHPVYIHEISDKYAILIERAPNMPHLNKVVEVMLDEYCDLVKEYSTLHYSELVKKAVDYIRLNIDSPLTLHGIADAIHANPSHLSRKFKQETGQSVIDFINHKRVESAKIYLHNKQNSITDVAFIVGFNDVNYFSRVFKKFTSMTPSQYMKQHKRKNDGE